jgi:thiamine biosynthesis lipoprotein
MGAAVGAYVSRILKEEEERMSRYRGQSEVSKINREAYEGYVGISETMKQILDECQFYFEATKGAFEPVVHKVKIAAIPEGDKIEKLSGSKPRLWQNIEWDDHKVRFLLPGIQIDLGGFGKGWAMEKVVQCLKENHVTSAFISFGESTITTIGSHPLGGPWKTRIPNHYKGNPLDIDLDESSISISGLKVKRVNNEEKKTSHIYHTSEARMIEEDRLTLVRSAQPLRAEILSTALMAADNSQKTAILQAFSKEDFFECNGGDWQQINAPV